ncbi:Uncharacterized protein Adt_37532 [Abeliophyllum distichum]|uniref:Uncharacterized protein n=1 Tax=Abeliophyllum distichum TaxID=126358 RepID=A0ABD1QKP7_9LAMI
MRVYSSLWNTVSDDGGVVWEYLRNPRSISNNQEVAGGKLEKWPRRLNAVIFLFQRNKTYFSRRLNAVNIVRNDNAANCGSMDEEISSLLQFSEGKDTGGFGREEDLFIGVGGFFSLSLLRSK